MKLLLEPDLSSYTDEAYEADLLRLPSHRYSKAMTYRFIADRKRCVKAYMLLWEGLRQEYGVSDAPSFTYGPNGKPFLLDSPEIFFSLSHTGNAVLCALDGREIGADIEMIPRQNWESLLRVFSEEEASEIVHSPAPEISFARAWTRKESFLKLTGRGLTDIETLRAIPTRDTPEVCFETVTREADGFVYSTCRFTGNPL